MITLFLMTSKGLRVLQQVVDHNLHALVDLVVVGTDANVPNDFSNDILGLCQQHGIRSAYRKENPTVTSPFAFAVSWQWMLTLPNTQLITFHDSVLPRYRGFAPLVTQLIKGDTVIGATALLANEEFDRGDILAQKQATIQYPIKVLAAIEIIEGLYAEMIVELVSRLKSGNDLPKTKQDESRASYSVWRDAEDYRIDWSKDASAIKRFIDAVGNPYLGAAALLNGQLVRILDAEVITDVVVELRDIGKVLFLERGAPVIICGTGLLKITAAHDEQAHSLLPFTKFRSRFK
jgi:methionyl-tRNA formyltransferase